MENFITQSSLQKEKCRWKRKEIGKIWIGKAEIGKQDKGAEDKIKSLLKTMIKSDDYSG